MSTPNELMEGVAIIAMAGRFPGANTVEAFWQNICSGVESLRWLEPHEDQGQIHDPALADNPNYVPVGGFLDDIDKFDATFFGYNALQAQVMDPQQRLFLQCAWEALERGGYDARRVTGRIGVYAGTGMNHYLLDHVYPNRDALGGVSSFQTMLSSDKDYLATRVAYKLGLRGPAITVQTACSTSLVAVALAYQSLMTYQCDMALAGGVSLHALEPEGYMYEQGGIASPDGHCRAFDAEARGTVGGSGLGIVLLKRLEDALADGDQIIAVIRGVAINNDGDAKMGYTAPSVNGQTEVITEALALARVDAESIGYIETHGTGTFVGDPIEIAALTQAFRTQTDKTGFCAIGSVKTNIGHLDAAAGIAGLIKASLVLKHALIPPSLNFRQPNPQIDFANSPFYVNTKLTPWAAGATPRRAGVSSFGIGGTNVHLILEEPPATPQSSPAASAELLVLSARTSAALDQATANLLAHLEANPTINLGDVAATLQSGRRAFNYRRVVVAESRDDAITSLASRNPRKLFSAQKEAGDRSLVFLFPGQGAQHVNMGRQLYASEPVYRDCVDYCCDQLQPYLGLDLRTLLFPGPEDEQAASEQLNQTGIAQAALFVTEYAMTRLLESCGVRPAAMIGHSLGEYVAACVAGVLSLDDALFLVAERGRLMQAMEKGTMLSISASAATIKPLLGDEVSLAVVYGPALTVVGGPDAAISALAERLQAAGIEHRALHTSHAFHSWMMDPMLEPFRAAVQQVTLNPPTIPYISCTTGTWVTEAEVLDPDYWARHVRLAVQLYDGLQTLLAEPGRVLVEVGPVQTLKALLKQVDATAAREIITVPAMRHPLDYQSDRVVLLNALGKLWLLGVDIDFAGLHTGQQRQRLVLPTYPFERRRYWIAAARQAAPSTQLFSAELLEAEPVTEATYAATNDDYVAPQSETERRVAAIWQAHLGGDSIGIHDNFFELGGDSLLAIGLMAKLRESFQLELSERLLYEHPSVAALSEAIEQSKQTLDRIVPISREQPLLASWQQQRRWMRDQLHPDQAQNNNLSIGWELYGELDAQLFAQSINEVVKRHEILRTSFTEQDGEVLQIIAPTLTATVPLIDLRSLPAAERQNEMLRLAVAQERMPFDLRVAPLWRTCLFQLDEQHYGWIIVAHQSIWDGVSVHAFQADIGTVLSGLLSGQPWELPELPVQFADVAHWERQRFQGALLDEYMAYWQTKLGDQLAPIDLPTDRPRLKEYAPSARVEWQLARNQAERIRALGQEHGATLYATMVAAFKVLCYSYTGQVDLMVEGSFPNRDRPELAQLIAPLVNIVTLRTTLSADLSLREVLVRVRETVAGAVAHRDLPFVKVLEELQPEFYTCHDRLGRFFIAQYSADGEQPPLPGLEYGPRLWFRRAMPDIYMSLVDCGDYVDVAWEYSTQLFDESTIRRMIADYTAILDQMTSEPNMPLDQLREQTQLVGM